MPHGEHISENGYGWGFCGNLVRGLRGWSTSDIIDFPLIMPLVLQGEISVVPLVLQPLGVFLLSPFLSQSLPAKQPHSSVSFRPLVQLVSASSHGIRHRKHQGMMRPTSQHSFKLLFHHPSHPAVSLPASDAHLCKLTSWTT